MTARPRILLVDDDVGAQESMEAILTLHGYHVDLASSGYEAVELCEGSCYDLVLLDIFMPGMDGVETLRRIKRQQPDTRVVVITGLEGTAESQKALEEGAEALFRKPLDVATFLPVLLPFGEQTEGKDLTESW